MVIKNKARGITGIHIVHARKQLVLENIHVNWRPEAHTPMYTRVRVGPRANQIAGLIFSKGLDRGAWLNG